MTRTPLTRALRPSRLAAAGLLGALAVMHACSGAASLEDDLNHDNNSNNTVNDATPDSTLNNTTTDNASYDGLVINEVAASGDPIDWFELYNGTGAIIDLTHFTFTDDIEGEPNKGRFVTGLAISPGAHLQIFVSDESTGFKIGADEELGLFDGDGNLVDSVDWADGDSPEGGSFSRIPDATGPFQTTTTATPNTPNTAGDADNTPNNNPVECGDAFCSQGETPNACPSDCFVIINEVAADGAPDDWVEIVNYTAEPLDLSDWTLTDDIAGEPAKGTFADGTVIEARSRLVVFINDDTLGFKIGADEELGLFDGDGNLVDSVDWADGDSPEGGSFSRIPDVFGSFQTTTPDSQGLPNVPGDEVDSAECGNDVCEDGETLDACPADCFLVINEIAAAGDPDDWFELVNHSNEDIDLTHFTFTDDLAIPDNATFDDGTIIAAGDFLVTFVTDESVGFKLGRDEELGLFDEDGNLVDSVDWADGDSPAGGSFARIPDALGDFQTVTPDSRGQSND